MKSFKVETYETNSSSWEGLVTYKPEYIWSVMKVKRHWWFPWFQMEYGVCTNLRAAEEVAKKKALHQAKIMFQHAPARVQEITILSGNKSSETLWMNGHLVNRKHWSLWHRTLDATWRGLKGLIFESNKTTEPRT